MSDRSNSKPSIRTTIAQAGHFIDRETGALIPAIQPSTTFARKEDYSLVGNYIYARNGSPSAKLTRQGSTGIMADDLGRTI